MLAFSLNWQQSRSPLALTYFGAPLLDSEATIVQFHCTDLNLDSLLRRACQLLKPYNLTDPSQTQEQEQCEQLLGESWKAQRVSK